MTVACAFEAARRIFDLEALVERINALDNKAPAAAQTALHQRVGGALRRATLYLSRNAGFDRENPPSILDVVKLYREPVEAQRATIMDDLSAIEGERVRIRHKELVDLGAPEDLAQEAALLSPLSLSLDVADLARMTEWPINSASSLHCIVGAEFGLDALRDSANTMKLDQHWDRLVVRRTAQDFGDMQIKLAEVAARALGAPPADRRRHGVDDASGARLDRGARVTRPACAFGLCRAQRAGTMDLRQADADRRRTERPDRGGALSRCLTEAFDSEGGEIEGWALVGRQRLDRLGGDRAFRQSQVRVAEGVEDVGRAFEAPDGRDIIGQGRPRAHPTIRGF